MSALHELVREVAERCGQCDWTSAAAVGWAAYDAHVDNRVSDPVDAREAPDVAALLVLLLSIPDRNAASSRALLAVTQHALDLLEAHHQHIDRHTQIALHTRLANFFCEAFLLDSALAHLQRIVLLTKARDADSAQDDTQLIDGVRGHCALLLAHFHQPLEALAHLSDEGRDSRRSGSDGAMIAHAAAAIAYFDVGYDQEARTHIAHATRLLSRALARTPDWLQSTHLCWIMFSVLQVELAIDLDPRAPTECAAVAAVAAPLTSVRNDTRQLKSDDRDCDFSHPVFQLLARAILLLGNPANQDQSVTLRALQLMQTFLRALYGMARHRPHMTDVATAQLAAESHAGAAEGRHCVQMNGSAAVHILPRLQLLVDLARGAELTELQLQQLRAHTLSPRMYNTLLDVNARAARRSAHAAHVATYPRKRALDEGDDDRDDSDDSDDDDDDSEQQQKRATAAAAAVATTTITPLNERDTQKTCYVM